MTIILHLANYESNVRIKTFSKIIFIKTVSCAPFLKKL